MKRVSWLLLAVFCTAVVRVQPVEVAQSKCCACCHCKVPGDCGMPCNRAPAPAPSVFAAERSQGIAQPASLGKIQSARLAAEKFYSPFVETATSSLALNRPALIPPSAAVPLYKAHCGFLV
jgi:hypothetical protein